MGADVLVRLEEDIKAAEAEKPIRIGKRDMAVAACEAMGWDDPDPVVWFVQRVEAAKQRELKARELKNEVEDRKDGGKEAMGKEKEVRLKVGAELMDVESDKTKKPTRMVELGR